MKVRLNIIMICFQNFELSCVYYRGMCVGKGVREVCIIKYPYQFMDSCSRIRVILI